MGKPHAHLGLAVVVVRDLFSRWNASRRGRRIRQGLHLLRRRPNLGGHKVSGALFLSAITSSADGRRIVVVAPRGMNEAVLYISSDYGSLWLGNGVGTYPWSSVASSADGRRLAACAKGPGDIWTSVDGGSNWTYRVPENGLAWAAIASSADGSRLAACAATPSGGGGVFTTINWNPVGTTYGGGDIYTTTNGGATWTERHWPSPKPRWNGICSSLDGSFLAACSDDYIYLSNDSGETWTAQTTAPQLHWASICCSSDGDHVAALAGNGSVYTAQ